MNGFARSITIGILCLAFLLFTGCAKRLPTPDPPKGNGWFCSAQGYQHFTATVKTKGANVQSAKAQAGIANARQTLQVTAEDVERTLQVGRNVSEFSFNEEMIQEYGL